MSRAFGPAEYGRGFGPDIDPDDEPVRKLEIPTHPDGTTDLAAFAQSLTDDEIDAMIAEMEYLEPHAGDDEAFAAAALAGRCYCAGRFICTRCKLAAEKIGAQ